ncbi:MAG: 30S ribosomal protein S4 [Candidatus Sungbacteria bacterium]|nr:30S ribosomal protein S4 [Candidatus Sungbacteria bacterium]
MPKVLEKVERRFGEKLFIKGERCLGPKCAHARRPSPPGVHGKKAGRKRAPSLFGQLLFEKQKVRFFYGLDDREIRRYSNEAAERKGMFQAELLRLLESRLDNALYRLGIIESRRASRQMISHGQVMVNGRGVYSPSFRVRRGDTISLKARAWNAPLLEDQARRMSTYQPPAWLAFDPESRTGRVIGEPTAEEIGITVDTIKIKEFYSR